MRALCVLEKKTYTFRYIVLKYISYINWTEYSEREKQQQKHLCIINRIFFRVKRTSLSFWLKIKKKKKKKLEWEKKTTMNSAKRVMLEWSFFVFVIIIFFFVHFLFSLQWFVWWLFDLILENFHAPHLEYIYIYVCIIYMWHVLEVVNSYI